MLDIHIDIETYSSADLLTEGLYRYASALDFEVLIVAWSYGDGTVHSANLASGETLPESLLKDMRDTGTKMWAHNAAFERVCLRAIGIDIPPYRWQCTANMARRCGLPASLADLSAELKLGDAAKDSKGKALIKYFSVPCRPTKVNGGRLRNWPRHDPDKFAEFVSYCAQDVRAELAIAERLKPYRVPLFEGVLYDLDQRINDKGVLIDTTIAAQAVALDGTEARRLKGEMKRITGLQNPNSGAQLRAWIEQQTGETVPSVDKAAIEALLAIADDGTPLAQALRLRQLAARSSVKKYTAMLKVADDLDHRARGLFQFCGAGRTGRWAGRLIQLQNLPRNYRKDLMQFRELVRSGQHAQARELAGDVQGALSEMIRSSIIAPPGHSLAVVDFSAIEARVIAWLAGEEWLLNVFRGDGKVYEAQAARMFGIPIESIAKDSEWRMKGKVSTLALGYQGGVGALVAMGALAMGIAEHELPGIVSAYRAANSRIVQLWRDVEAAAKRAMHNENATVRMGRLAFKFDGTALQIQLPSRRCLVYWGAHMGEGRFGAVVKYRGPNPVSGKWSNLETYGGKLVENVVQAIARDLLAEAMVRLDKAKYDMAAHVHDEVVIELPDARASELHAIEDMMSETPIWADGLPLAAEGFVTKHYKK